MIDPNETTKGDLNLITHAMKHQGKTFEQADSAVSLGKKIANMGNTMQVENEGVSIGMQNAITGMNAGANADAIALGKKIAQAANGISG